MFSQDNSIIFISWPFKIVMKTSSHSHNFQKAEDKLLFHLKQIIYATMVFSFSLNPSDTLWWNFNFYIFLLILF